MEYLKPILNFAPLCCKAPSPCIVTYACSMQACTPHEVCKYPANIPYGDLLGMQESINYLLLLQLVQRWRKCHKNQIEYKIQWMQEVKWRWTWKLNLSPPRSIWGNVGQWIFSQSSKCLLVWACFYIKGRYILEPSFKAIILILLTKRFTRLRIKFAESQLCVYGRR